MIQSTKTKKTGFTLIELLIVISIISILAAILFPVFARTRENARRTSCLSNGKQIGMGLTMYLQDYDEMMPLYYFTGSVSYAWNYVLTPYIKSDNVFICPSATQIETWCGPTSVKTWASGSYGYSQFLGNTTPVALAAVQLPSETIAIGEITQTIDPSMYYAPTLWANSRAGLCGGATKYGDQIATRHFEGAISVFMDGHTKWLKKTAIQDYNNDGTVDNGWFTFTKP